MHTSKPDSVIQVIKEWPGNVADLEKAPTEISYSQSGNDWGYKIQSGAERHGGFKLLLDANTGRTQHDNIRLTSARSSLALTKLPVGKSASTVTTDYLRLLYNHLIQTLRERMILSLDNTPIQFVLTTPAIWSHQAQQATCTAAMEAGFASRPGDTLTMVSEPEAAASYCFKEIFSERKETESPLRVTSYRHPRSISTTVMVSENNGMVRLGNGWSSVMLAVVLS
jgi:hypothetical protein